jgi:AAA+ superfamily predicted ATPase
MSSSKDQPYSRARQNIRDGLSPAPSEPLESVLPASWAPKPARLTLADVVQGPAVKQQLEEALIKIRHYRTIYVDWGFMAVDPAGKGVVLNFYGPPGTGKTLTAEALAGSLGKPLMFISIADLESKFMGDTAKNIVQLFKHAADEAAVLFFDEADTLLGKRLSSVTQGVDNEVNAMRSTLLIELEKHEGVVVFATNFAKNYDSAFVSRISQHVKFVLPEAPERHAIWSRLLVHGIPLQEREALLEAVVGWSEGFSGRDIRTCMRLALPKALAAGVHPELQLEHLEQAIAQVKTTLADLANDQPAHSQLKTDVARKLLGVK